jgi:hypothetical protein
LSSPGHQLTIPEGGVTHPVTVPNRVDGTVSGAGNIIAFNGGGTPMCNAAVAGIWVHNAPAINNAILGNSIFSNADLGIDLEPGHSGCK